MKRFLASFAACLLLLATLMFWKPELRQVVLGLAGKVPDSPKFITQCLDLLNDRRQRVGVEPLTSDAALQSSLEGFLASVPDASDIDLEILLRNIQQNYPDITVLSATVVWHPTAAGLVDGIAQWDDGLGRSFASLSTVTFRDNYRRGCIGLLAHRLPTFNLQKANAEGGRFHHLCPRCRAGHSIELDRSARTVQLRCPHCQRPYDILASDTLGHFHRAPSFLTGFSLRDLPAAEDPSEHAKVKALWHLVTSQCRYERDGDGAPAEGALDPVAAEPRLPIGSYPGFGPTAAQVTQLPLPAEATQQPNRALAEAWQTPSETWLRKAGDCEDTSLLLADLLISEGFDARVALGWNAQGGDHAWCVVRLSDGSQYLLETTLTPNEPLDLIPAAEASAEYRPEQLFDRRHLYFPIGGSPGSDYWSEAVWSTVVNKDKH